MVGGRVARTGTKNACKGLEERDHFGSLSGCRDIGWDGIDLTHPSQCMD